MAGHGWTGKADDTCPYMLQLCRHGSPDLCVMSCLSTCHAQADSDAPPPVAPCLMWSACMPPLVAPLRTPRQDPPPRWCHLPPPAQSPRWELVLAPTAPRAYLGPSIGMAYLGPSISMAYLGPSIGMAYLGSSIGMGGVQAWSWCWCWCCGSRIPFPQQVLPLLLLLLPRRLHLPAAQA